MFERKYKAGTKLRMLVRMEADGTTVGRYLDYYRSRRPIELARGNGHVEIEVMEEWDSSDDSYWIRVTTPGVNLGHTLWCAFEYLSPLVAMATSSGMPCHECKNGYPYAEPNYENDKLICWSCCDSNRWKYNRDKKTGLVTKV